MTRTPVWQESQEEQAARAASLLRQGAAVVTWRASQTVTGLGVGWVTRSTDRNDAYRIERRIA